MNKANFTFFHLKRTQNIGAKLAGSMFLFLSLLFSANLSAQTVSCNGNLNISVDPATCQATITPATVGVGGDVVVIDGLPFNATGDNMDTTDPADDTSTNGTASVVIDVTEIPAFLATGMVMDITYNLIAGTVDAPTNSCWGTFLLEDKAAPTVRPGMVASLACDLYDEETYWDDFEPTLVSTADGTNGDNMTQECTNITVDFSERRVVDRCVADTIFRTWRVTDVKGNTATVADTLELTPEPISDLTLPPYFDGQGDRDGLGMNMDSVMVGGNNYAILDEGTILCSSLDSFELLTTANSRGGFNPAPNSNLPSLGNTAEPYGTGRPGGVECGTINAEFEDLEIDVCEADCAQTSPSYKILREWTIVDWCTGNVLEYNQIIKIEDTLAPMISDLADVTISTDLWGCGATYILPAGTATDNCTATEAITVTYGSSEGTITNGVLILPSVAKTMPGEEVEVYVNYSDCCGNIAIDTFLVSVEDQVPPVVVADRHTVVSLSQFADQGLAKVFAETFDDGSFDGCGPIGFGVRRMNSACDGLIAGETGVQNDPTGVLNGDDNTLENEDGTDSSFSGTSGYWFDYVHFCCDDLTRVEEEGGEPGVIMVVFRVCDDANMDGIIGGDDDYCNTAMVEVTVQNKLPPVCQDLANVTINCIDLVAIDDVVNAGPLTEDGIAKVDALFGPFLSVGTCSVSSSQILTSTEDCGSGTITRVQTVTGANGLTDDCEQIITVVVLDENVLGCEDINFPAGSPEALAGYDWCETNNADINDQTDPDVTTEDFPAVMIDGCGDATITAPEINIDNLCSEVGINLTVDTFRFNGTSGGCLKLLAHWEIIDQCIFDENYLYQNGTGNFEINPFVAENGYFEIYVEYDIFDTEGPVITCNGDLQVDCGEEITQSLSASATDECTLDASIFGWSWRLDLDADEDFDAEGEGSTVAPGDVIIDGVALTSFPEGSHSITWIVSDGCGNISSMDCPFGTSIVDEKAPTPYCYDGLSTAVMGNDGTVVLWAEDFNVGSFDACSAVSVYIIPESDVIADGLDDAGALAAAKASLVFNPATGQMENGWTFDCDDFVDGANPSTIDVRMYAEDESMNADYCVASLRLIDNQGFCGFASTAANIGGTVSTENNDAVDNVLVEATADNPEFPKFASTNDAGDYVFNGNALGLAVELSATRDDNHMNGVSTLDLVIIQKHILNIESLDSPYKRIAADINNDSSIKVNDLLQLRKLILGLYEGDALPSNEAWRFVDANFQFADPTSPFPFNEVVNIASLDFEVMAEDFVAVKVGDVNSNVGLNAKPSAAVRSNKALTFNLADKNFAAGEIVELEFTSADFAEVAGYQFTLEFAKGLTFNDIVPGALNVTEANFGLNRISEGVITTSFDDVRGVTASADDVLFTVKFAAENAGSLSDFVKVSSANTAAEAYLGAALEVVNVNATFRTNEIVSYVLHQNEPNPFKGTTLIRYELPTAANATLQVFDVTGKVLYNETLNGVKGMNEVSINGLNASGVMYYQLDSDDFTATKKMIVIE